MLDSNQDHRNVHLIVFRTGDFLLQPSLFLLDYSIKSFINLSLQENNAFLFVCLLVHHP